MKDYSAMTDAQINSAVGMSFGENVGEPVNGNQLVNIDAQYLCSSFDPCNNPADAWPIIVENGINIFTDMIPHGLRGQARVSVIDDGRIGSECLIAKAKNPLRAAMIVFLMMKDEAVNTQGEKA